MGRHAIRRGTGGPVRQHRAEPMGIGQARVVAMSGSDDTIGS